MAGALHQSTWGAIRTRQFGEGVTSSSQLAPPVDTTSFLMVAGGTSPNNLSTSLVVNGTTLTLMLACDATSAGGMTCTPDTLAEAGSGTSPVTSILTPMHAWDSTERGLRFGAAQKRLSPAASSTLDLTTEDFVVEAVVQNMQSGAPIIDKSLASVAGWQMFESSSAVRLSLRTASSTVTVAGSISSTTGSTAHILAFVDRDEASTNGAVVYTDGTAGTGANLSTKSGSLSNAVIAGVGAVSGGSAGASTLISLRVWRCPTVTPQCFVGGAAGPTEMATIAKRRTAVAFGVSPSVSLGSSAPTTFGRLAPAFTDVVDGSTRMLYTIERAGPRVAVRTASGVVKVGYLSEPQTSNVALQSQTLATTWAPIDVGDNVLSNTFIVPDRTTTGDDIDGDNTGSSEHGLRQSISLIATNYTMSVWSRPGEKGFIALRNATIASGAAWFDLTTCISATCTIGEDCAAAVGTVQAGVSQATASRWPVDTTGDGIADITLCRASISYTATLAAHNHDLLCAPADNATFYTDTGASADCGFWGVSVYASLGPDSYVGTTSLATTRVADDLRFSSASIYLGSPTTLDTLFLCPNYDLTTTNTLISLGSSATDYARIGTSSVLDRPNTDGARAGAQWNITGASGDVYDGQTHTQRVTMQTNDVKAFFDSTIYGTDVTATLPTVAGSFLFYGTRGSTAQQPRCLIMSSRVSTSDLGVGP